MLTVTDTAKGLLKETLLAHNDEPENSLRLVAEPPGRLGLVLSKEGLGDQVLEHEGTKVLLVGPDLATVVDGVTLDVQDTEEGRRLVVVKE